MLLFYVVSGVYTIGENGIQELTTFYTGNLFPPPGFLTLDVWVRDWGLCLAIHPRSFHFVDYK